MFAALGFFHMQSASDRDKHVKINWQNIQNGMESNFAKYDTSVISHFNGTYDYVSIMHYDGYAFSKNGHATIVPKVSYIQLNIVTIKHQSKYEISFLLSILIFRTSTTLKRWDTWKN